MELKKLRQILKACAEDTRLRILNLLSCSELTVKEICLILHANQPLISKHLTRLRLLRLVIDRREGKLIYYSINGDRKSMQYKVIKLLLEEFKDIDALRKDRSALTRKKRSAARSTSTTSLSPTRKRCCERHGRLCRPDRQWAQRGPRRAAMVAASPSSAAGSPIPPRRRRHGSAWPKR